MNDTPNNHPTNKLRRWFSNRLENRIDRLWFGGVLATNAVALLFGAKYIGVFLIAYCFIFVLCLRAQIRAAYPAQADVEYHIGYEINWPHWQFNMKFWLLLLGVYTLMILATFLFAWLPAQVETISAVLTTVVCNGFLLCRHRTLFIACCGGGQLSQWSERRLRRVIGRQRNGAFPARRLMCFTVALAAVWGGLLALYVTGQFGGRHIFGLTAPDYFSAAGVILFAPALVHLLFLETMTTILRGWGDKE